MFCCGGSKCLDDEETGRHEREKRNRKQQNQQIYIQRNGIPSGKDSGKLNANMLKYMPRENDKVIKPDIKHVTNVQKDVYVKFNSHVRNVGNFKTVGHQGGSFQVIQVPRSHSAAVRQTQKRAPIVELNPAGIARVDKRPAELVRDSMRLSTEFKISSDNNRTSTPFDTLLDGIEVTDDDAVAIFDNKDTDSLTDEQRNALEKLEETLNGYQIEDDEAPMIIADILSEGISGGVRTSSSSSPPESSEDEPSSRSSSLSISSRTGIISQRHLSVCSKRNRNSVSFQLPVDHVDKPYTPMQRCSKVKQASVYVTSPASEEMKAQPTAICISGNSVDIWHSGNSVYVENKQRRRLSGPFKGSFKSLFYGQYSNEDLSGYKKSISYLTPRIMEKVASYESLTDDTAEVKYRGNPAIIRRNTFR